MVTQNSAPLDTVTTIQIHLILAHPTDCLKAYSFITNNDNAAQVDPIQVSKQSNNQKVSSNPQTPHYIVYDKHLQCCAVCGS